MSKYTITIEGDFEKGDCLNCPLYGKASTLRVVCNHTGEKDCPLEKENSGCGYLKRLYSIHAKGEF